MKILIEGTALFEPRTGVGQYLKRLFEATLSLDPKKQLHYFCFQLFEPEELLSNTG